MPAISPSRHKPSTSLGERRGLSDLACFSIDLTRADTGIESATASRSRDYPSPPMSGSPPLPPKPTQEAGERSQAQGPYQVSSQPQDVYHSATLHHRQPEEPRGQLPPSLPPPPPPLPPLPPVSRSYRKPVEPAERMGYYPPPDDTAQRRLSYPLPGPSHIPQQPVYQGAQPAMGAQQTFAPTSQPAASTGASAFESPRPARKAKGHVASACVPCKKAHLRCDAQRPCSRCLMNGKEEACIDVQHKKRGRPRLRDDRDTGLGGSRFTSAQEAALRRPLEMYPGASIGSGYEATLHRSSQSQRVLKSQPRESAAPRFIERASVGDANIFPAPPPSAAPSRPGGYGAPARYGPPEPVAYLTTDLEVEVLKASPAFLELIGASWVAGHSLYTIMDDADKHRFRAYLQQLLDDWGRADPRYPPPLSRKEDSESALQGVGFSAEEVSQFRLDRQCHITFTDKDRQPRPYPVQYGIANLGSAYVVVLRLNVAPQQQPYPSPSPHSRESAGPYAYPTQPAPHQQQQYQAYAQRTPVSATFDPSRPRFEPGPTGPTGPTGRPLTAPPPGRPLLSGFSPSGASPGVPGYSPSPSRPDYGTGPPSYQVPRSEVAATTRAPPPMSFQLPPIRTQPQTEAPVGEVGSASRETRTSRVDIGGLIDKPEEPPTSRQ